MGEPLFIKCEPCWPSDTEETSNIEPDEELSSVNMGDVKVEPAHTFVYPTASVFIKEEQHAQDEEKEPDHEDHDKDGQLPNQIEPYSQTTTNDDPIIIMSPESALKQMLTVGRSNSDASYFEIDLSDDAEKGHEKWNCDCCSKSFKTELLLEKHMLVHGKDATPGISAVDSVSNGENTFACEECGKMLDRRCVSEFSDTRVTLCQQCNSGATSRSNELFICHHCGKKFPLRAYLARHMRIHSGLKPYSCIQCRSAFSDLADLKRHEITHTTGKVYICTFCDEKFTCQNMFMTHLYIHKGASPYKCTECGKSFTARWLMRRHTATHNKSKSFVCYICKKPFVRKSDLDRHVATHTGERTFKCSYCSRTFARKCTMQVHMITHTKEKPHFCSVCTLSFSSRSALKQHMAIHAVTSCGETLP